MADSWSETSRSGAKQRGKDLLVIQVVGVMLPADIGVTTALPTVGKLVDGSEGATDWETTPTTQDQAIDGYIVQTMRYDRDSQAGRVLTYATATAMKGV